MTPLRAGAFTSGILGILPWGPGGAQEERYGGNMSYAGPLTTKQETLPQHGQIQRVVCIFRVS